MYNIGIIGIGFLGGSLIKSLSKSKKINNIIAYDINEESLKMALREKTITTYTTKIDDSFSKCDIIFICTPVSFISGYIERLKNIVKNDCIITDVGSTKKTIIEKVKNIDVNFIGGHPMIGSERSGYSTSKDILFENSYYIITKNSNTEEKSINILKEIILELKAIPILLNENEHDYITASISHVPHVVAAALVNMVKNLDDKEEHMKTLAAGGFKDITRIASSDPTMWENICIENREEISKVLDYLIDILSSINNQIKDKSTIYDFFDSSKKYRDSFINRKINGNVMPELNINIKDENGAIAKIATILNDNDIGIRNIEVLNNRENNYGSLRVVFGTYDQRDKGYEILSKNNYEITKIN